MIHRHAWSGGVTPLRVPTEALHAPPTSFLVHNTPIWTPLPLTAKMLWSFKDGATSTNSSSLELGALLRKLRCELSPATNYARVQLAARVAAGSTQLALARLLRCRSILSTGCPSAALFAILYLGILRARSQLLL
jgi:hypothetical protein